MGLNSKLVTKIIGASVFNLPKEVRKCAKASTYNFVSGTGNKGNFEIYSFFDNNGKLLKRISTYVKNNNEIKFVTKYTPRKERTTVKLINGEVKKITKTDMRWGDKTKSLWTENVIFRNSDKDMQKISLFERGCLPKIMQWQTCWSGQISKIEYKNMDEILLSAKECSYLPPLTNTKNFRRFRHMAEIQYNEQGIRDIYSGFYVIPREQVKNISKEVAEYEQVIGIDGVCDDVSCKIYVVFNKDKSVADEASIIAHEIQHAKDHSDIARLEDTIKTSNNAIYYDKSRALGIIKKNEQPAEYKRLSELRTSIEQENYYEECMNGNHDVLTIEKYAIDKGEIEANVCSKTWRKIMEAFNFW